MARRQFLDPPPSDPRHLKPLEEHLAFIRKQATARLNEAKATSGPQLGKKRKRDLTQQEKEAAVSRAQSLTHGYNALLSWSKNRTSHSTDRRGSKSPKVDLLEFILAAKEAWRPNSE